MDAAVMRRASSALIVLALLAVCACQGVGISGLNNKGAFDPSDDEKAEDDWWDRLYGRKSLERESKAWKDFYKAPNQDDTKPDYCGFWGNCAAESSKAPASCNFYGNCTSDDKKQGWW